MSGILGFNVSIKAFEGKGFKNLGPNNLGLRN